MTKIKIRRSNRIVRQTSTGGLAILQQQFSKYTPFEKVTKLVSQKRFGIAISSIWLIMLFRSALGGSSFNQLEKDWNKDSTKGILVRYRKKLTHRLLARNLHRFSPQLSRKIVLGTAKTMFQKGLLTAKRIAIDSTFILVSGSKYPKVGSIKRNGKFYTGYKLSIAFDIDAKILLAYIITSINVHDSQLLIPLVKMVLKEYKSSLDVILIDRGYYGGDFFQFLNQNNIKFFIPAKKYAPLKRIISQQKLTDFKTIKKLNLYYKDSEVKIAKYGKIRCIFVLFKKYEEKMPSEEDESKIWVIFTNDYSISPKRVIRSYRERWQIEVFFKGIKNELGLRKLPGRDYRIINVHISTVLLAYLCLQSLNLEERMNNESIPNDIKEWKNRFIFLVLTIYLRGRYIFLEFQEKWVSDTKTMEAYLNGGIFT